jgi:hypothetical protein
MPLLFAGASILYIGGFLFFGNFLKKLPGKKRSPARLLCCAATILSRALYTSIL